MFSGKTEELIRRLRRALYARQKIEIYKPQLDTRYATIEIVSHTKQSLSAKPVAKAADILVNLSNDGWFVWKWGPWAGQSSAEHAQHLVQYCFRAIETRTPVVRAVNTGISALIDSSGRVVAEVGRGNVRAAMLTGTLLLGVSWRQ